MSYEDRAAPVAWPLALAGAAILGTLATACMMPFVAIATITAATMTRAQAMTAVFAIWAANQLLGFGLLNYPRDAHAIGWGVALGASSMVALFVARHALGARPPTLSGLALAFAASFVAYESMLLVFALVTGGTGAFTPTIVLLILGNDAGWLVGLTGIQAILIKTAPRLFGAVPTLRLV